MIILDTNVVSEPLKPDANPAVSAWLNRQLPSNLFLTTVTLAELLLGVAMLPPGNRRALLDARLGAFVSRFAAQQMLAFDAPAARLFAVLVARARVSGRAIAVADGQIAAIAAARGFAVATRDTLPFVAAGVPVINPWSAP